MDRGRSVQSSVLRPAQISALIERARGVLRARHCSIRTEDSYLPWMRRFIGFHQGKDPRLLDSAVIEEFLTYLAVEERVAASTQNQALSAVAFLYRHVLKRRLSKLEGIVHAKRPVRLPVVLTQEEVQRLLEFMSGRYKLMAGLLYGSGLRLMECVRLRVQDIDFGYRPITVRDGTGHKDRIAPLPDLLMEPLREHPVRQGCARAGPRRGIRDGLRAIRARAKARELGKGLQLAVRFSSVANFERSSLREDPATSHSGEGASARRVKCRPSAWSPKARVATLLASLVCYASARKWLRHQNRAGAPRALRCAHNHDLYACAAARWPGCQESSGLGGGSRDSKFLVAPRSDPESVKYSTVVHCVVGASDRYLGDPQSYTSSMPRPTAGRVSMARYQRATLGNSSSSTPCHS